MKPVLGLLVAIIVALLRLPFTVVHRARLLRPLPILSLAVLAAVVAAGWIGFSSLRDTPPQAEAPVVAAVPAVEDPLTTGGIGRTAADYAAGDAQLRALIE